MKKTTKTEANGAQEIDAATAQAVSKAELDARVMAYLQAYAEVCREHKMRLDPYPGFTDEGRTVVRMNRVIYRGQKVYFDEPF